MKGLLAAVFGAGLAASGWAHRLDEYLQSTRISLEGDRLGVSLEMTPGAEVSAQVLREIDRDGDGVFSSWEEMQYAASVGKDLKLAVNGRDVELRWVSHTFPIAQEVKEGTGKIRLEFEAVAQTPRRITFENRHLKKISVYTANLVGDVPVRGQKRSEDQSHFEAELGERPSGDSRLLVAGLGVLGLAAGARLIWRRRSSRVSG